MHAESVTCVSDYQFANEFHVMGTALRTAFACATHTATHVHNGQKSTNEILYIHPNPFHFDWIGLIRFVLWLPQARARACVRVRAYVCSGDDPISLLFY